ncbi:hypothetical protein NDU88_001038 [Pleurodeles waltl]|uniref:Uncharacterized protein n=1 Tax=Pleurodeles waltl TaxID=8319 RepID=A0AAV7URQ7_PLEWA|nr:hypothetical protein NDU88_001038 [Pleurodeles waltl]
MAAAAGYIFSSRSRGKLAACQATPPRTPRPPFLRLPWWAELRERSYADADAILLLTMYLPKRIGFEEEISVPIFH